MATFDARGYLVYFIGGFFFLRSLYLIGEVIGFRLFRATGLAFAIRRTVLLGKGIFKVQ